MAIRFPARGIVILASALVVASCNTQSTQAPVAQAPSGASQAERDLAKQAKAFQKTVVQGIAVGVTVTFLAGGKSLKPGGALLIGVPLGAAAGTYVAHLQKRYTNKERRLDKARGDVETANKELEAAIATMRAVLAQQRSELAAIRKSTANNSALAREVTEAQGNLRNMERAIDGAEGWRREFSEARSVLQVEGQLAGIDPGIAALSQRIATMRKIANSLANEI